MQINTIVNNNLIATKNLHLVFSVLFIIPIPIGYGVYPDVVLPRLFGFKVVNINLVHIFRTIMVLYLANSASWIIGILHQKFWFTATIMNICFMGGLAAGRLLSLALDGLPSKIFVTGLILELIFALWGLKNVRNTGHVMMFHKR